MHLFTFFHVSHQLRYASTISHQLAVLMEQAHGVACLTQLSEMQVSKSSGLAHNISCLCWVILGPIGCPEQVRALRKDSWLISAAISVVRLAREAEAASSLVK